MKYEEKEKKDFEEKQQSSGDEKIKFINKGLNSMVEREERKNEKEKGVAKKQIYVVNEKM